MKISKKKIKKYASNNSFPVIDSTEQFIVDFVKENQESVSSIFAIADEVCRVVLLYGAYMKLRNFEEDFEKFVKKFDGKYREVMKVLKLGDKTP